MSDISTVSGATRERLFNKDTRNLVYKALDANAMRGRAIAQNIANVQTPGYRRVEVNFEEQVQNALSKHINGKKTNENHMDVGRKAAIKRVEAYSFRPDFDDTNPSEINNVDIDIENAKLAENQISQSYNMQFAGFGKIQAAIKGQPY
ncbi:MAG: flagellar basal body rod protein FlgB [Fibromonadaceae bacterium]|jgi:flagellar basal-body rod protein FlgB|nr:flagellar basal body rod protein FlgB [Fibromonadaceae bacterium]